MPLGMHQVGLGPSDIVLDGDPAPSPQKEGQSPPPPIFGLCLYSGQTARWTKMPLGTEIGLGPGHIMLDGDPALPKRAQPPIFTHVCCGQTARWTKMPLGMKVGLGTGHIVLHGDPAHRGRANNCFTTKLINRCCACQSRRELK